MSVARLLAAFAGLVVTFAATTLTAPAALAVGPTSIELLSPQHGATVVGKVVFRARVTGPPPDDVWFQLGAPPKGSTFSSAEIVPGIWETTVDLATFPARSYAVQAVAQTTASGVDATTLESTSVGFTVDREFDLGWIDPAPVAFSPDGDALDDEIGIAATSSYVGYARADSDLWVADATGTRLRTIDPWFSGTDPFGNGATAGVWNGQSDSGTVVPDGWYCVRLTVTASNGRHGSIALPVRVDVAPAEVPAPAQPAGDWCAPAAVPSDPPLVETPYPPLPATEGEGPTPTTPESTTPTGTTPGGTTPTESGSKTPTTTQSESAAPAPAPAALTPVLPRTLPPTGPQFATKPLFAAGAARRSRGRLTLALRCVAGCAPGEWLDLELWTVGAAPKRKLVVRARVSARGVISISRRVRGTLPRVLELRAPQSGVALPVRVR